jgi:hypothetical protein
MVRIVFAGANGELDSGGRRTLGGEALLRLPLRQLPCGVCHLPICADAKMGRNLEAQ